MSFSRDFGKESALYAGLSNARGDYAVGGIQLFCLGIMGQYIAKLYLESKGRPHYIISETNGEHIKKIQ